MKMILKIAKTELQTLFYSPVAWLIIIVFTFQASILFTGVFGMSVRSQALEYQLEDVSLFHLRRHIWTIYQHPTIPVSVHPIIDHGADEPGIKQWFHQITLFFSGH